MLREKKNKNRTYAIIIKPSHCKNLNIFHTNNITLLQTTWFSVCWVVHKKEDEKNKTGEKKKRGECWFGLGLAWF